jgi:hypothetical protein
MASSTFTVVVNGTYGPSSTTVPVECPTVEKLRRMGQYQLGAYATRYPLAQQVLAEKRAAEAAYEQAAAERDAVKAAKASARKAPSTGNEPGASDTARANTPPTTTVGCTTLATATDAQLIAELLSRHTTVKALEDVALAFDAALLEAENMLEVAPKAPKAPTAPTAEPAPATKQDGAKADTRKAADREPVAAHTAKQDGAKLAKPADAPKPAPTWTDATLPKTHKAVVALGKDGVASLATWLGVGTDGMNFANAAGAVWAALKAAEPAKASEPAPKAKAKGKPAPKAESAKPTKQEKGKADPSDPILPGVFDAAGRPMTVAAVMAALDAYKAPKAKAA